MLKYANLDALSIGIYITNDGYLFQYVLPICVFYVDVRAVAVVILSGVLANALTNTS